MPGYSRRSLLAFGGLLMGGARALAAPKAAEGSAEVAQARVKLAQEGLKAVRQNISRGGFHAGERDPVYVWSRRRYEARQELARTKADRIAAAQEHFDEMSEVERLVEQIHKAGEVDPLSLMDAQYRRLEAETWLARAKEDKED
jgi:hypothetical protein